MNPTTDRARPAPAGMFTEADRAHMRRALDLAWQGLGYTDPNPTVGAVVVAGGEVVAGGFHARCGAGHAETVALDRAGSRARGATMYVTLEPCSHHGRTPPCADAVVAAGIERVVIPTLDPDPLVNGAGVERLRAAGVTVEVGCLAAEAVARSLPYYRHRLRLGPTVTLKMAATRDDRIASAPGRRDAITGDEANLFVHRLRAASDCVVVGAGTVRVDRPRLDARNLAGARAPVPVVLDASLRTPPDNGWAAQGREYVILCGEDAPPQNARRLRDAGARVVSCRTSGGRSIDPAAAASALFELGLERILVEGGGAVFTSFLDAGVWHACHLFRAPVLFGAQGVPLYNGNGGGIPGEAVARLEFGADRLDLFAERAALDAILSRVGEGW